MVAGVNGREHARSIEPVLADRLAQAEHLFSDFEDG